MMDSKLQGDDDTNSSTRPQLAYRPDELMVEQIISENLSLSREQFERQSRDLNLWDDEIERSRGDDAYDGNNPGALDPLPLALELDELRIGESSDEADSEDWNWDTGTLKSTTSDPIDGVNARDAYHSNLPVLSQSARQSEKLSATETSQFFDREASTSFMGTSGNMAGIFNVQEELLMGMPSNEPGSSNANDMPPQRLGLGQMFAAGPGHAQSHTDGTDIFPRALFEMPFLGQVTPAELHIGPLLPDLVRSSDHTSRAHPASEMETSHSTPGNRTLRKRAKFSEEQTTALNTVLATKRYPCATELLLLSQELSLPVKVIKTWLSNHRYRPALASTSSQRSSSAFDMASPMANSGDISKDSHATQPDVGQSILRGPDPRGRRRGRKDFYRLQQQVNAPGFFSPTAVNRSSSFEGSLGSTFEYKQQASDLVSCSWPWCGKKFAGFKSWIRHEVEEYQPFHYICCLESTQDAALDQCPICSQREVTVRHVITRHLDPDHLVKNAQRTFYRRDHLGQHLRSFHKVPFISREDKLAGKRLLDYWTIDHFHASPYAAVCIFCGHRFSTWIDRSKHVYKHVEAGICRSAWWPERLPLPRAAPVTADNGVVTCANCRHQCGSISTTLQHHAECTVWSCGFLHDFHALFDTDASLDTGRDQKDHTGTWTSTCKLCGLTWEDNFAVQNLVPSTIRHERSLQDHAETQHEYRSCMQDRFNDQLSFAAHLRNGHHATQDLETQDALLPWRSWQCLTLDNTARQVGQPRVLTATVLQQSPTNPLCTSKSCAINFGF